MCIVYFPALLVHSPPLGGAKLLQHYHKEPFMAGLAVGTEQWDSVDPHICAIELHRQAPPPGGRCPMLCLGMYESFIFVINPLKAIYSLHNTVYRRETPLFSFVNRMLLGL